MLLEQLFQRLEGRHSAIKLVDPSNFNYIQFVSQDQFLKVVDQESLEVDVELHRIVLGALEDGLIPETGHLIEYYLGI